MLHTYPHVRTISIHLPPPSSSQAAPVIRPNGSSHSTAAHPHATSGLQDAVLAVAIHEIADTRHEEEHGFLHGEAARVEGDPDGAEEVHMSAPTGTVRAVRVPYLPLSLRQKGVPPA